MRRAPAYINAYSAFCREVSRRGLDVPERLRDELRYTLRVPVKAEPELYDRLIHGCQVLDAHGGDSAPDSLWRLWEALLIAWQCAEEAAFALQVRVLRGPKKGAQPKIARDPELVFRRS